MINLLTSIFNIKDDKTTLNNITNSLMGDKDEITKMLMLENIHLLVAYSSDDMIINRSVEIVDSLLGLANWKLRAKIPRHIVHLAKTLVRAAHQGEKFINHKVVREGLILLMGDKVFEVREEAIGAFKNIASLSEKVWLETNLANYIDRFLKCPDQKLKLNYFFCLQRLAKNLTGELQKRIISELKGEFGEGSSHIRIAIADTLKTLVIQMNEKSAKVGPVDPGQHQAVGGVESGHRARPRRQALARNSRP